MNMVGYVPGTMDTQNGFVCVWINVGKKKTALCLYDDTIHLLINPQISSWVPRRCIVHPTAEFCSIVLSMALMVQRNSQEVYS